MAAPSDSNTDPLVEKRIKNAITMEMKKKGLVHDTNDPDLKVAIHTYVKDKVRVDSWGYGYASSYWRGYWGPRATDVYQWEEGTLVIDLVDAADNELVWRGEGSKSLPDNPSPDKIDKIVNSAVKKILANYPPKQK
jgi:hypothetical protein